MTFVHADELRATSIDTLVGGHLLDVHRLGRPDGLLRWQLRCGCCLALLDAGELDRHGPLLVGARALQATGGCAAVSWVYGAWPDPAASGQRRQSGLPGRSRPGVAPAPWPGLGPGGRRVRPRPAPGGAGARSRSSRRDVGRGGARQGSPGHRTQPRRRRRRAPRRPARRVRLHRAAGRVAMTPIGPERERHWQGTVRRRGVRGWTRCRWRSRRGARMRTAAACVQFLSLGSNGATGLRAPRGFRTVGPVAGPDRDVGRLSEAAEAAC